MRNFLCSDLPVSLEDINSGGTKKMKITRRILAHDGRSYRQEEKVLQVDIRPGWKAGTKVTFPKEGDQTPDKIAADVVFVIRDRPHERFKRDGADLRCTEKITLKEV